MLHDILFALLGFPGDIIVSAEADPFTAIAVEERERENEKQQRQRRRDLSVANGLPSNEGDTSAKGGEDNEEESDNLGGKTIPTKEWKDWHEVDAKSMRMTFMVKEGYPHLQEAEREQINRIVPLGWYYNRFQAYCDKYDMTSATAPPLLGLAGQQQRQSSTQQTGKKNVASFAASSSSTATTLGSGKKELYRMALTAAIQDLLNEYTQDIAELEQLLNQEEDQQLPLSHFLQHVQKYLIVFPQFHEMLLTVERNRLRGCQILDFFAKYATGVPVLNDLVQRILFRLRSVLLKQIFAWMIFGELQDEAAEFFIQAKDDGSGNIEPALLTNEHLSFEQRVLLRLAEAKLSSDRRNNLTNGVNGDKDNNNSNFEWNSSFFMRLENVPDSHISPLLATKVIFAGKAALMLQQSATNYQYQYRALANPNSGNGEREKADAYAYFAKGGQFALDDEDDEKEEKEGAKEKTDEELATTDGEDDVTGKTRGTTTTTSRNLQTPSKSTPTAISTPKQRIKTPRSGKKAFFSPLTSNEQSKGDKHDGSNSIPALQGMSYSFDEITRFDQQFQDLLYHQERSIELLEHSIEQICETISNRLWYLLKEKLGFLNYLTMIRNTFLTGKGEFFQCLLDDIHVLTHQDIPKLEEMDEILNWKVLRNASKLVGLDDDEVSSILKLRVDSSSVHLEQFLVNDHRFVTMNGSTSFAFHTVSPRTTDTTSNTTSNTTTTATALLGGGYENSLRPIGIRLGIAISPPASQLFDQLWQQRTFFQLQGNSLSTWNAHRSSPIGVHNSNLPGGTIPTLNYLNSAIWFNDTKYVVKGFKLKFSFTPNWMTGRMISPQHSVMKSIQARHYQTWPAFPPEIRAKRTRDLILGSIATCLHGDNRTIHALGKGELCREISNSLVVGVSFHACVLETDTKRTRYYARLFVVRGGNEGIWKLPTNRPLNLSMLGSTSGLPFNSNTSEEPNDYIIAEKIIDLDRNLPSEGVKSVETFGKLRLEVDYLRLLNYQQGGAAGSASVRSTTTATSRLGGGSAATAGATGTAGILGDVQYRLRLRLIEDDFEKVPEPTGDAGTNGPNAHYHATAKTSTTSIFDELNQQWDLEIPIDLAVYVKCQGGQSWTGVVSSALVLDQHNQSLSTNAAGTAGTAGGVTTLPWHRNSSTSNQDLVSFSTIIHNLHFDSKNSLFAFPVCSPFTSARYPDTYLKMEEEVSKMKSWINLKLQFNFPTLFKVIFDSESIRNYERVFTLIMKTRLVGRILEKLWMSKSKLITDRMFCSIRQAMHFFLSNFLYYLQVDVVDSEYCALIKALTAKDIDFQTVLKQHRLFLSNILRLSMIDNIAIQESIDRILQVCIRFVAACRLQSISEYQVDLAEDYKTSFVQHKRSPAPSPQGKGVNPPSPFIAATMKAMQSPPVYVPLEEFDAIKKEFYLQLSYLFQYMRKVETRGFLFRLDFNGFLSQASLQSTGVM